MTAEHSVSDWVECYPSHEHVDPLDLKIEQIHLHDIAHSLSMQCRYNGHVKDFYSVAEHSVLVSYMVPQEHALTALMHDATEAYLSDVTRPMKKRFKEFITWETKAWVPISEYFGLPLVMPQEVIDADDSILYYESPYLIGEHVRTTWTLFLKPRDVILPWPFGHRIKCLSPRSAETRFLERFYELTETQDDYKFY